MLLWHWWHLQELKKIGNYDKQRQEGLVFHIVTLKRLHPWCVSRNSFLGLSKRM